LGWIRTVNRFKYFGSGLVLDSVNEIELQHYYG